MTTKNNNPNKNPKRGNQRQDPRTDPDVHIPICSKCGKDALSCECGGLEDLKK